MTGADPGRILRHCLARPARLGSGRLLSVDGPAGSGKSTLAAALLTAARQHDVTPTRLLHLDDMYEGWHGLRDVATRLRDELLVPLARGERGRFRRWDWAADAWAEWVPVEPADLIVLEGVGSGADEIAPYLTTLVWVDASYDVRMARGLARDGEAFAPHWEAWAASEAEHFAAHGTEARADVWVGTSPTAGPGS